MKKFIILIGMVVALFGFDSISNPNSGTIEGKVTKAYTQQGYGKWKKEWLFMDIVSDNGTTYKIAIAPTFRISNLPIKEGDRVKVDGFTPSMFPQGVIKAVNIYDITQQKDYPIAGWGPKYARSPSKLSQ